LGFSNERRGANMGNVFVNLQTGDWITRQRVRLWALAILVASLAGIGFLLATSDGLNDYQGRPLGTDFSDIYAGGTYVLDGKAALAFDPPLQHAASRRSSVLQRRSTVGAIRRSCCSWRLCSR